MTYKTRRTLRRGIRRWKKKRSKRSYGKGFTLTRGPGLSPAAPFPKKKKMKLRYVQLITLDSGAGGIPVNQVFRMNSLYDPDFSGAGHQPLGFDQIMPMYDHYTVIGSRMRVTASNLDTTVPQIIALQLKDIGTTSTNTDEIIENGQNRWTILAPQGSGGSTKTLTLNCSPSKFFGRKVLQGDKYQGSSTSDPTDLVYGHIHVAPQVAVDPASVRMVVELEYVVLFTEPKQLGQS